MFILTGSLVSAIETVKVNPVSLSMKKGESKKPHLDGEKFEECQKRVGVSKEFS